jgi:hypothetical protein
MKSVTGSGAPYYLCACLERGDRSVDAAENKAAMRRIMEHVINEKNLDAALELFS